MQSEVALLKEMLFVFDRRWMHGKDVLEGGREGGKWQEASPIKKNPFVFTEKGFRNKYSLSLSVEELEELEVPPFF